MILMADSEHCSFGYFGTFILSIRWRVLSMELLDSTLLEDMFSPYFYISTRRLNHPSNLHLSFPRIFSNKWFHLSDPGKILIEEKTPPGILWKGWYREKYIPGGRTFKQLNPSCHPFQWQSSVWQSTGKDTWVPTVWYAEYNNLAQSMCMS